MNLLASHFDQSPLRPFLSGWEKCEFKGERAPGILAFELSRDGERRTLLVSSVIRREEDLIWKSCHELFSRTLKDAAAMVRGFYGFDLLSLSLGEKMQSFQWNNFGAFIVNQARTLVVGETKLIQYTSVFGILKKRVAEEYGKMDYRAFIKVYTQEPAQLDLFIKKILKAGNAGETPIAVLQDLSREPLFRFGDEEQTPRLRKLLEKIQPLPETFIMDSRGLHELGAQFGLRNHV